MSLKLEVNELLSTPGEDNHQKEKHEICEISDKWISEDASAIYLQAVLFVTLQVFHNKHDECDDEARHFHAALEIEEIPRANTAEVIYRLSHTVCTENEPTSHNQ